MKHNLLHRNLYLKNTGRNLQFKNCKPFVRFNLRLSKLIHKNIKVNFIK